METRSRKRTLWNAESDLRDPFVAKINKIDSDESRATLIEAARAASRECVKEMLDHFRDVEPVDAFSFNISPRRS